MSIAQSYRLARAGGAAVFLFVAIAGLWWVGRNGPPERVFVTGTIEAVYETTAAGNANRVTRVLMEDGREARVMVPTFAVRLGQKIPLMIEVYHDGDEAVMFDAERWIDSAGS